MFEPQSFFILLLKQDEAPSLLSTFLKANSDNKPPTPVGAQGFQS